MLSSDWRVMTEFALGDYHRWLYKTAADLLPGGPYDPGLEDLVQEGRVALWKAAETFDEAKGTLAPWITNAARMRMRDLVQGHGQATGHIPTKFQRVTGDADHVNRRYAEAMKDVISGPAVYIDAQENPEELALARSVVEFAEPVLMEVLRELPEEQREYIWLRFWCGVEVASRLPGIRSIAAQYPVLKKKWVWQKARETLRGDPRILALI